MPNEVSVRVNQKAAARARSGHPWLFASDVIDTATAQAGDAVRVIDPRGRVLGTAHYSSSSQIALRLLTHRDEEITREWLRDRFACAQAYRDRMVSNSNAYRMIHAEGDLLPGLIVDRYGDYFSIQVLSQGMSRMQDDVVAVLGEMFSPKGILARNDAPTRAKEELPREIAVLAGDIPERIEIAMNGLRSVCRLATGQKTGLFLDQRENYAAVARYARGRALDCFTGTGGFALHMAARCESVEALDSSAGSIELARENANLNNVSNCAFTEAEVLDYLPGLVNAHRTFDIVVVDPPAFTKSRTAKEGAARGYKEVNLRTLRLLRSGGVLVSCSCSHHMSEADLLGIIAAAALDCGKQLRVLERRMQSQDHPVLLTVPETLYLKCLIFEVL